MLLDVSNCEVMRDNNQGSSIANLAYNAPLAVWPTMLSSGLGRQVIMTEMIWLNGETRPMAEARIDVEDRGYQFADGVYEVIRLYNGRPFTLREHLERLERSADGLAIKMSMGREELGREIIKFAEKSG